MSHKSWCYTVNNYTEGDVAQFKSFECNRHRCALEVGENGTPHLQGVITFPRTYRLKGLKKLNIRAHWEPCESITHSLNYCTKGEIIIDVNNRAQGKRNDLAEACDSVMAGDNIVEVALKNPLSYIKFNKGLEKLKSLVEKKNIPHWSGVPEVIVLIGRSGCGKSRRAYEIDPELYSVAEPSEGGVLWFDGYDGEKTILFDDFYGWVKYSRILQITDGYKMQLQIKGGHVWKQWDTVIFTSNKPIEEWWYDEDLIAFKRRVTQICDCD